MSPLRKRAGKIQPAPSVEEAIARAGKDAELRFYPPGAHGAAFDENSYVTMTEVYTNALCEHIAQSCTPANLNR